MWPVDLGVSLTRLEINNVSENDREVRERGKDAEDKEERENKLLFEREEREDTLENNEREMRMALVSCPLKGRAERRSRK